MDSKKDNNNHRDRDSLEFEYEPYSNKPAFRILSRSSAAEVSGWAEFFRSRSAAVYSKGSVIVAQGEENPNIFYIVRGLVEYTNIGENGSENILEILGPGNMLNLQPTFGHNPPVGTFAALSECVLASADVNLIFTLIEQDHTLALEMLEEMAFIIGGLNRQLSVEAERSDIRTQRVIHMIATIHRRVYKEEDPIYIRLSQSDLARIIRTTRVTISKILADMKRRGILETDYGGVIVTNFDLLTQLVKSGQVPYSKEASGSRSE
ncbi:MAG: Crp/Fnr family transcriptional regulator [Clostridiales bacterium]|nr:Crp/Fnr family transcriptional regulator [Clostridiales bacterium]